MAALQSVSRMDQGGNLSGCQRVFASRRLQRENQRMFQPGQNVRVNLAGMQVGGVMFQAAVTAAAGTIVRQTSQSPPVYLVKLLFSFRGLSEVEVPEDRIQSS